MGTGLRSSLSYHRRLFLLLLAFSWALVACFIVFQYGREKQFKAERLDTRLQLFNLRMLDALADGATPEEFIAARDEPFGDLRVTVIDAAGRVTFDNSAGSLPETNHLDRPEVAEALARGTGFTIRRHSESTDLYYFYSAMSDGGVVVRSAVPYSITLREVLAADREFLWFMLGVTLLMSVAAYFATRRLGHNITRLRDFAQRAERGERIDEQAVFPHDELGDISSHIIRLYARLQRTTADRDREHALALHEQQEKIRIKKQLTNNINHELKTPVAAIQGYLETLLDNPGLGAEKRTAFLEKSCAQVARLRSLLADISTGHAHGRGEPADPQGACRAERHRGRNPRRHAAPARRATAARELRLPLPARNGGQPLAAGFGVPQPRGQRRGLFGRTRHFHPPAGRLAGAVHAAIRRQRHRCGGRTPAPHFRTLLPHRQAGVRASWAARGWGLRSSKTP